MLFNSNRGFVKTEGVGVEWLSLTRRRYAPDLDRTIPTFVDGTGFNAALH
jgi:hypothetical protein